ncbi:hypothetical protein Golomagni_03617 [Golovinomyces magnicellulatus]|nr:hypothetical protein Golomagni_03617 [Golovinomyces magnicellulatus]
MSVAGSLILKRHRLHELVITNFLFNFIETRISSQPPFPPKIKDKLMANFAPFLLKPSSLGLLCGLSMTTRHILHLPPIRLDGFSNSEGHRSLPLTQQNVDSHARRHAGLPCDVKTIRQITTGSICGLCAGLFISAFSRPLVIIVGLLGAGFQCATLLGINFISCRSLQAVFLKDVDLWRLMRINRACKASFCITFLMAGFLKF